MSGDKPDPRLRTPMQWDRSPAAGFTRGLPWEPLHADSFTANVEVQQADSSSLLNLHRRLIHLRAANKALESGELIPLVASHDAVAAYLRRSNDGVVLVVANLGTAPLTSVNVSSEERALAAGRYTARALVGAPNAQSLRVGSDGRIKSYVPLRSLAPMETYLLELSRER
jgi:glycosidase